MQKKKGGLSEEKQEGEMEKKNLHPQRLFCRRFNKHHIAM